MKSTLLLFVLFFISLVLQGQHTNIVIDAIRNNYPNEPAIKIDPNNSDHMLAASNINNYYTSIDGGLTWTIGKLSSFYGVWGDPSLAVDDEGNFYFFHLSNPPSGNWIDRIVCQKTSDVGQTWTNGSFMGLNGQKAQDKEWPTIDRKSKAIYVTWTQFDEYGSFAYQDSSHILFSSSFDGGENWTPAFRLDQFGGDCVDDDDTVEGAVPTVGPEGQIYVAWAGPRGIVFDKSYDQGNTWLARDLFVSDFPGGWNYEVPGISRCNGLPVTVCDTSVTVNRGNIYINWTDQRNGENDTDVWLSKSTDEGESWGNPVRVNDDPAGKHQFFTWMDVDPTNGYIYVVFYDRRNYVDTQTDVFLAVSMDGGETFSNHKISESPFIPNKGIFFGDYTNISVHNDVIRPIWTRLHDGRLEILTAIIDADLLTSTNVSIPYSHTMELDQNYPNPFKGETYISFKLHKSETLDLSIYNNEGEKIAEIFKNRDFEMGKHVIHLSEQLIDLQKGIYYYILNSNKGFNKRKMMQIE